MINRLAEKLETLINRSDSPLPHPGQWQVVGPIYTTKSSAIYKVFNSNNLQSFAMKLLPQTELREQFAGLQTAHTLLANEEDFHAPTPIAQSGLDQYGVLVMDWIEGPTLQNFVSGLTLHPLRQLAATTRAGELLSHLHANAEHVSNALDTAVFINDIDLALDELPDPVPGIARLRHWLAIYAPEVSRAALSVTDLHGDYKPANIILNSDGMHVIDGQFKFHGVAIQDAAHFLNHLALNFYLPQTATVCPGKSALLDGFISGCQFFMASELGRPLQWFRIQKLAMLYLNVSRRETNPLSTHYLKFCILREAHALSRSSTRQH